MVKTNEVIRGGHFAQTPINLQYDAQLIAPHIKDAMKLYVIPLLGKELYDDMLTKMNEADCDYENSILKFPNDAVYEKLWTEELYSFCCWVVYLMHLPTSTKQNVSAGLSFPSEHNKKNSDVEDLKFMLETAQERIRSKRTLLISYLEENKDTITKYKSLVTECLGEKTINEIINNDTSFAGILFY